MVHWRNVEVNGEEENDKHIGASRLRRHSTSAEANWISRFRSWVMICSRRYTVAAVVHSPQYWFYLTNIRSDYTILADNMTAELD